MSVPCLLLSLIANVLSLLKLFSLIFREEGSTNVDVRKVSQILQEIPIALSNTIYSYSDNQKIFVTNIRAIHRNIFKESYLFCQSKNARAKCITAF